MCLNAAEKPQEKIKVRYKGNNNGTKADKQI